MVVRALVDLGLMDSLVWIRRAPLDDSPAGLYESLLLASDCGSTAHPHSADGAESFGDVGRRLAQMPCHPSALVIEDPASTSATEGALETLLAYAAAVSPIVALYINHGRLRRRLLRVPELVDAWKPASPDVRAILTERDPPIAARQLARLTTSFGDGALLFDVLDAAQRDPELLTSLMALPAGDAMLELSRRMLERMSGEEVRELANALRSEYWHPHLLGARAIDPRCLRPWMMPLEGGWWWMRPFWRNLLGRFLDPSRRSARRYLGHRIPADGAQAAKHRTSADADSQRAEPPKDDGDPSSASSAENPSSRTQLSVTALGEFEVRIEGKPVGTWHGRLAREILAFLVFQSHHSATKEQLIETFWPGSDPDAAQNRLRVAISSLRRDLRAVTDAQIVEFHDGGYRIDPTCELELDVDRFEADAKAARKAEALGDEEAALAAYRRALGRYRADLLTEYEYQEWTILPREALRVLHHGCLERASALLISREVYGDAIDLAWSILASDPANERAHRLIIECHAATGQYELALRQHTLCRQELAKRLGIHPSPGTEALMDDIRIRMTARR
jgi:DNA-binding SARP family transcriptional activator